MMLSARALRGLLLLLVSALLALAVLPASAGEQEWKTVVANGVGAGPDKAKARDEAIQDAQRKAVGQGLGLYINSETLVTNGELISDTIYTKTTGYVRKYAIQAENYNPEKELYWVRIEAQLSTKRLEEDLDDLWERLKLGSNPRLMVFLTAQTPTDEEAVANALVAKLVATGFKVLDATVLNSARQKAALQLIRDGHAETQDIMLLQDRSDVIITGRFSARSAEEMTADPKTFSVKSTVQARIVATDTAEVIAAMAGEGAGVGFDAQDALAASQQRAVDDWYAKNLGLLVRLAVDPCKEYNLYITGCTHEQIMQIDAKLADSRFFRKCDLLAFDKGYGKFSVQYNGAIKMLAAHLTTAAGIPLEVESITANTVRVHAVKKR